ncbi:MAG TPA: hypothetical protein VGY99_06570 [Candidatus Binataceae bacterium]|jgi:hypothetical protein|nr:hypothetical protein [Candidatus Binataceae bacterium]
MKKFAFGIIAAAFGSMLLLPAASPARAQDWQHRDMANDAYAIHREEHKLRHDNRELQDDVARGDYGAAAHEQAEMAQRRYNLERREQDLNNDRYRSYNGYGHHGDEDDD